MYAQRVVAIWIDQALYKYLYYYYYYYYYYYGNCKEGRFHIEIPRGMTNFSRVPLKSLRMLKVISTPRIISVSRYNNVWRHECVFACRVCLCMRVRVSCMPMYACSCVVYAYVCVFVCRVCLCMRVRVSCIPLYACSRVVYAHVCVFVYAR